LDFAWSEEQAAFRKEVLRFAKEELNDDIIKRDHDEEFSQELWQKCAKFGIQGLPIPTEYGGGGADTLTTVGALEMLGYGCADNGLIFSINAHMWSSEIPIWSFGTEEQKRKYLPGLVSGGLGLHAMTEPGSGSDAYSLKTRAERKGDRYILNGSKTFSSNAPNADVTIVFANLDPSRVSGRQRHSRIYRRQEATQDGIAHLAHGGDFAAGLRDSGLESARQRIRRAGGLYFFDGVGAHLHPGQPSRGHAAHHGNLREVCQGTQAVWRTHRKISRHQ
jgi:alkylation response protein AidB-like acyl-CoA dehydrogenase